MTTPAREAAESHKSIIHNVASRIDEIRRIKGLSKGELATLIKCEPSYLSRVLSGRQNLTLLQTKRIARALGVKVKVEFYE